MPLSLSALDSNHKFRQTTGGGLPLEINKWGDMTKQTIAKFAIFLIVAGFFATMFVPMHYSLPRAGISPNEGQLWIPFLLRWYAFWFVWVPLLAYLLWRVIPVAGLPRTEHPMEDGADFRIEQNAGTPRH
jgi:hypothetical protein